MDRERMNCLGIDGRAMFYPAASSPVKEYPLTRRR
jgi:hypothetical protein